MLGNQIQRPVIDKTGLTGRYDFSLDFRVDLRGFGPALGGQAATGTNDASDPGADLATSVEQQLGLRLVAGKANLDVLVVEKVEKTPTEN